LYSERRTTTGKSSSKLNILSKAVLSNEELFFCGGSTSIATLLVAIGVGEY
jgi:hypothetical protein